MLEIVEFGHINIVVDNIDEATQFYQNLLGAKPIQYFPHFKNVGLAKAAGFLDEPQAVDLSINFLRIPNTSIYLELICYHNPKGNTQIKFSAPNDLGGPRHLCLRVKDINSAFEKIKKFKGVKLINPSANYKPYQLDTVSSHQFKFLDDDLENDLKAKQQSAEVSSKISFFYFTDKYGVQWELEEAPEFLEDPALSI